MLRQADGVAHDALDQRLVADELAAGESRGEQPVDHRSLPLEEGFAVKGDGHAAEHQAGEQRQPLAFFQLALNDQDQAVDDDGAGDQDRRGAEDAAQLNALAGDFDGARIEFVDDEKEDQRNEIDELLHVGSQGRVGPA